MILCSNHAKFRPSRTQKRRTSGGGARAAHGSDSDFASLRACRVVGLLGERGSRARSRSGSARGASAGGLVTRGGSLSCDDVF